jgi:large subunit ribosomal protein L25
MATQKQFIDLAKNLHPRLTRFFARYPPPALGLTDRSFQSSQLKESNVPGSASGNAIPSNNIAETTLQSTTYKNPFQPQRCEATGRLHDPIFSLRRQADLVKLAEQYGVESLLPFTIKSTEHRYTQRVENGLRVKGTGVGQKVKGKEWERSMRTKSVITPTTPV